MVSSIFFFEIDTKFGRSKGSKYSPKFIKISLNDIAESIFSAFTLYIIIYGHSFNLCS